MAQINLHRPDSTTAMISSTPGCYCIQPPIHKITNSEGFTIEFYDNWSCSGDKIDETEGVTLFSEPVQAYSARVIKNEDGDRKHRLYREGGDGRGFEEEYDGEDLDIYGYEPHKNYALATNLNNGFGAWNMDSFKISKKPTKAEAEKLFFGPNNKQHWEFSEKEFEVEDEGFGNEEFRDEEFGHEGSEGEEFV
ncbi:hypothetical protein CONCODRAFT_14174 [Conidiobolus coronatus NRRL 28638]|uniref:Uncharacterized protein n=1 Tax=Conidiobolus coronatus (strain ATCC 28846 / CBS 209.66 / NRRL 28638) TaxID=796925 RepID=A0A137NPH7_CONC2|nr:hypothetical protein CONCODRAFT_14174 [Conidiobolus coronatus NRRL 28638]|eukprot:KXN64643.1 hypothetical protein CONCODRAFT_14174 [Conidiobolus coronatus NRRL 28638]